MFPFHSLMQFNNDIIQKEQIIRRESSKFEETLPHARWLQRILLTVLSFPPSLNLREK